MKVLSSQTALKNDLDVFKDINFLMDSFGALGLVVLGNFCRRLMCIVPYGAIGNNARYCP
jgi:hypothetical protein